MTKEEPTLSPVDTITTDENGNYNFLISAGKFGIVRNKRSIANQYQQSNYGEKDWQCLQSWVNKPDLTFEVTKEDIKIDPINLVIPCSYNRIPCPAFWKQPPR